MQLKTRLIIGATKIKRKKEANPVSLCAADNTGQTKKPVLKESDVHLELNNDLRSLLSALQRIF